MINKQFGKRFKEARNKKGLTQEELAEKLNLPVQYISYLERGAAL